MIAAMTTECSPSPPPPAQAACGGGCPEDQVLSSVMMQDLSGARRDAMLVVALALIVGMCAAEGALAAKPTISGPVLAQISAKPDEWFKSDEGVRAAENIVGWQNENGGWWKFY